MLFNPKICYLRVIKAKSGGNSPDGDIAAITEIPSALRFLRMGSINPEDADLIQVEIL
jgi:hypothetical protein